MAQEIPVTNNKVAKANNILELWVRTARYYSAEQSCDPLLSYKVLTRDLCTQPLWPG